MSYSRELNSSFKHLVMSMVSNFSDFTPDENPTKSLTLKGVVSEEVREWYEYIVYLWICSILSYLGIVNNIVIMVVFNKMGFKETVNISMTAIAIWDLVKSISASAIQMYGAVELVSEPLAESWRNISMIVFGYILAMAGYSSVLLAAYVAIERCLCVSLPFTVKYLLTRKFVLITSVTISVVVVASKLCAWANYELVSLPYPNTNETYIGFKFNAIHQKHPGMLIYIYILNVFYPILTWCISSVCTIIITYHLRKASKFRSKMATDSEGSGDLSQRDRQVVKMLVVVIIVYIICFLPRIAFYMTENVFPEFNFGRRYSNVYWCMLYTMIAFDLINSTVNIFIFYAMSSQFKATLNGILHISTSVSAKK